MSIAVITGASAGLGRQFAYQLDGDDQIDAMWLIARRQERLQQLAADLSTPAEVLPTDLTDPDDLSALYARLEEASPHIRWLINNAGFGKIGAFDAIDVDTNMAMLDLNMRTLTELTQRALPHCQKGSHIVQVSSLAAFMPVTNFGAYSASKAYVLNFSDALHRELKPRGISVTSVCPGPVATEFLDVASTEGSKTDLPGFVMADAPSVVTKAISDARRGRRHSIYGWIPWVIAKTSGVHPRGLTLWITEKIYG